MKRKHGYLLQRIADTYYLLPYGQLIADHRRGLSLNDTGIYVWNLLEKETHREDLRAEYLKNFADDPSEYDSISGDLDMFLNQLISLGIIEDDDPARSNDGKPCTYLEIGGLKLKIYGPKELIESSTLKDFCVDKQDAADQTVTVNWGERCQNDSGALLIKNYELEVYERVSEYQLIFPTFSQINEVYLSKDGERVHFNCTFPYTEQLGTEFFHALRHVFLYLAAKRGMYAIHSASILYADKAWLFSAVSGTGKSTHANLWKKLYETPIINGDLNLLAIDGGRPVIRGIPWCGTSEIFDKKTLPLGGIILLKQSPTDSIVELPPDKKALLILQRFISPMWTAAQLEAGARFAEEISEKISVCRLLCTKNDSAAELMKGWADSQNQRA